MTNLSTKSFSMSDVDNKIYCYWVLLYSYGWNAYGIRRSTGYKRKRRCFVVTNGNVWIEVLTMIPHAPEEAGTGFCFRGRYQHRINFLRTNKKKKGFIERLQWSNKLEEILILSIILNVNFFFFFLTEQIRFVSPFWSGSFFSVCLWRRKLKKKKNEPSLGYIVSVCSHCFILRRATTGLPQIEEAHSVSLAYLDSNRSTFTGVPLTATSLTQGNRLKQERQTYHSEGQSIRNGLQELLSLPPLQPILIPFLTGPGFPMGKMHQKGAGRQIDWQRLLIITQRCSLLKQGFWSWERALYLVKCGFLCKTLVAFLYKTTF